MGNQGGAAARRAQKIAAIAAAGVVLLGGATVTSLAAWTDTEYVVGGVGDEPGIGTSTFEVEQNTSVDPSWENHEDALDPGVIDFSLGALALSPGDTVYGFVQLRTTAASTVGGTLSLIGATDDGDLFDALTYGARIVPSTTCDETTFSAATGTDIITASGQPLSANGTQTFTLLAASGDTKTVCFAVTLDDDAPDELQGETSSPLWNFSAISD